MKIKVYLYICCMYLLLVLSGCSVNKFIPQDSYLLDDVKIESDNKEIKPSYMTVYVRQNPNAKWFSLVKIPMYIYSASGQDSTRWINRLWRRLGDAPVIYDRELAQETRQEIQKAVQNIGYMGASVTVRETPKGNRMKVCYQITSGEPYVIDYIGYDIDDARINALFRDDSIRINLQKGMRFDVNQLDAERQRITQYLQDRGYYRFNKDFITFQADTILNTHKIDLTMQIAPFQRLKEDSPSTHRQYTVREVNYLLDTDPTSLSEESFGQLHRFSTGHIQIYYNDKMFLRPKVLEESNFITKGQLYQSRDVQNTYASLSRLHILKYSNIRFREVLQNDSAFLDAYVTLSRNKNKSMEFEIEGTNSAGDLGAAASVTFNHRNLFKGSESFSLKLRGAYEAITGLEGYANSNYMEYGVESSLNFPEFMFPFLSSDFKRKIRATSEVSVKYNWQIRPEFERTLASAAWSYHWTRRGKATHRFDLLDINYIYMPYTSPTFEEYLDRMDEVNPLLRHSYEDLFIVRLGYTYTYNSAGASTMQTAKRNSYSIRLNIEEAGNLMYGISRLTQRKKSDDGIYQLANINFAQYVKLDFDYAKNFMIDERNALVFHTGIGVAVPYGNSKSLPFEKLYFSGGANSVRGWGIRTLGPGTYQGDANSIDYVNHTGDIKIDLNLEYRTLLFWKLNGALFIDAGNIWNIRSQGIYSEGVFRFDRFYKQLAVSYGLGIRFDLDFLILRFDGGMKAINPMESGRNRFPVISPNFKRDFAFHFAVGYPF